MESRPAEESAAGGIVRVPSMGSIGPARPDESGSDLRFWVAVQRGSVLPFLPRPTTLPVGGTLIAKGEPLVRVP
jgi:hypothetical protein